MELEIKTRRDDGTCVMTLAGEIDVYTAPRLKDALVESIASDCANLIIDLESVAFIDSSGLGVLVGALRRAKERGGVVRLVCTRDGILKVFRITGLDKVFPIFADTREASEF
jgi:anti-sigma B factor antagonist